jgi:tether containing UBX domain for GLUT4
VLLFLNYSNALIDRLPSAYSSEQPQNYPDESIMASNVVVIDSTARRATVKTTPGTTLSQVLEEACKKLGYQPEKYGLKYNSKQVDLSRTYRLSGLVSGAKLELVQLSNSVGVVSVALQLPPSDAQGVPQGRLTDKFPSNTTLWMLLRKFESGAAGEGGPKNFTARGVPADGSGSGRLVYEQPVLHLLNRELSTFADLQKTLAQLGLNSGSALVRMTFRPTQRPLEDALQESQAYFDSLEETPASSQPARRVEAKQPQSTTDQPTEPDPQTTSATNTNPEAETTTSPPVSRVQSHPPPESPVAASPTSPTSRPVSVFRPPSGIPTTPQSTHNDSDFTPTIEHAQAHQRMLNEASRNRRLKTDAELATAAAEEAEKLAQLKDVEIKIRFPDQSALGTRFGQLDTGATLYSFVRDECLDERLSKEVFALGVPGAAAGGRGLELVPDSAEKRLIRDLKLRGRVLLVFAWDEKTVSAEVRAVKNVLRDELRARAQDVKAPELPNTAIVERGVKVDVGGAGPEKEEKGEGSGGGMGKKMPKWLKGLSKKS